MRVVLDAHVIVAATLSSGGTTGQVLRAWLDGAYELVASPHLLEELARALAYPKIRARVTEAEAEELLDLSSANGQMSGRIRRVRRHAGRSIRMTIT